MIKKINIILVLIAIIGSLSLAISKDNNILFFIKDISIILTINGLYIFKKVFKIKISDNLNLFYIIFIFVAHFLGVTVDLYSKVYWFDKFVHFISGIFSSVAAIFILFCNKKEKNILFNVLFILSFAMLIASYWEIFEYLCSCYFNVDPQKVVLTGVADTMGDIIVALLGSVLISIIYYYKCNKKIIIEVK